jgi:uroporphyrinogen-III synthase
VAPVPGSADLSGFTVGVTADRRGDEQTAMLTRLGATVVRGPVVKTLPVGGDHLREVTEDLIGDPPDYLVANTALGIRSWTGMAAKWGRDAELRRALAGTRIAARGPKAAAAVGMAGLDVWWKAEDGQLTSVGQRLLGEDLSGRRVALQLHGDGRQGLTGLLEAAGAQVVEIPVYRWTLPDDLGPALRLVDLVCSAAVDAVTFTAGPAVRNFMEIADRSRRGRNVLEALNRGILVACVGPVCAAAAAEEGVGSPVHPERWRLGPLVRLVRQELVDRRRRYRVGATELVLQGSVVLIDGDPVRLTDRERAVLAKLAERPGAMISRRVLLRHVWKDPNVDPRVLETTIGRLRAKLGPSGSALETTVRRGYRLRAAADRGPS